VGLNELTADGKYETHELEALLNKHHMLKSHVLEDRAAEKALDDEDNDFDFDD
tara:strand:+ start:435 stop:593 length:159 start_codon:yes stop_codon:yes gene_type:complete